MRFLVMTANGTPIHSVENQLNHGLK